VAILREGRLVERNQVSHLTHLRQQEVAVSFATAHVRQRASVARRPRSEEYVVFITLTTDLGTQSHGVGMMEAVIAEIAPQARVIHYTHGIADYDTTRAARVLGTVRFIMPAIHVCVCDPGVGTARRPLAILTHRGDIVIGPDNGVLLPAVAALGGAAEIRQITNPAVMRHPVSAVFHGRDVFCPTAAQLANGLSFQLVGEPVDPAILAPAPYTDATPEEGRWMARVIHVDKFGNTHLNISQDEWRSLAPPAGRMVDVVLPPGRHPPCPLPTTPPSAMPGPARP
jgi:S-adenosylmethionine hydrolase